jgi:hypothetical protein
LTVRSHTGKVELESALKETRFGHTSVAISYADHVINKLADLAMKPRTDFIEYMNSWVKKFAGGEALGTNQH